MENRAPLPDEDIRIANLLTNRLGIEHDIVFQDQSYFDNVYSIIHLSWRNDTAL